ncbi:MAG: iron-containing alcohol dehydrogenase [Spirochaetales bacterium]|nr:iron-containing alcohol dehydrogenase [Spirochaetales bacterium]
MISSNLSPLKVLERKHITKAELKRIAGGSRIAIVTDNAPIEAKERLISSFSDSEAVVFDKVQPNPRTDDIMQMYNDPAFATCDVIVGIGGGSVLDSAKALAMLKTNGGNLDDYLGNNPSLKITKRCAPLVLLPTTAGTGSEVTKVGVYTSQNGRKYTLGSPLMHAHKAVLVQDFVVKAPPALVASTGLDALDHALESIWNKNAKPETLELSVKAAVEVLSNIRPMYDSSVAIKAGKRVDSSAYDAARRMLHASCMAGMAFNLTGTAAGHALSFVLSETWHVPHGTACAFTLNGAFRLACEDKNTCKVLARVSKAFHPDLHSVDELVRALQKDIADLTVYLCQPQRFSDLGIELTKDRIDENFERSFDDPKMWNHLPVATKENIYPLLEELI